MGRERASSKSLAEQVSASSGEASGRRRRGLAIATFSRAPATGVWYYRVDVSVYQEPLLSTFLADDEEDEDEDDSSDDDQDAVESLVAPDVEHYSVLRRYSDFLDLFEKMRRLVTVTEGGASCLPPFPVKEYISPALVGMLWRVSSSQSVLEERRTKFEVLLRWIENHPTARNSSAFVDFLGKPPQSQNGYVSLKEYTSPDWLSSLQQVKDKEDRKRRYSVDSSAISLLLEKSAAEDSGDFAMSRRQYLQAAKDKPVTRLLGKRRHRSQSQNQSRRMGAAPYKKVALTPAIMATQHLPDADQDPQPPQSCAKRKVARVEGNRPRKKQCSPALIDATPTITVC
ncbi:hypothetical protein BBJ28_00002866 [Nothophytophthora sp. Chile5]|nr:hypothetical protein BBJ28_00002866 [Nothophytophthora sp. Chile5]